MTKEEKIVTFVRGKYEVKEDQNNQQVEDLTNNIETVDTGDNIEINHSLNQDSNSMSNSTTISYSKEVRVAKLYQTLVYYPFVTDICVFQYGHKPSDPIPEHLRAVSWMDEANAQMKLITSEENMQLEKGLKITCAKYDAAYTGIEQAADLGPIFKGLKTKLNTMETPNDSTNQIVG